MELKYKILILAGVALLSYATGRYLQPAEVRTETKVVEVEVEKEKIEYRTIVRHIKNADGTTITEEIKEEIKQKEDIIKKQKEELKIVKNLKPQWKVGALAGVTDRSFTGTSVTYGLQVERRILGPVFVGAWGLTTNDNDETAGLSISMEF